MDDGAVQCHHSPGEEGIVHIPRSGLHDCIHVGAVVFELCDSPRLDKKDVELLPASGERLDVVVLGVGQGL